MVITGEVFYGGMAFLNEVFGDILSVGHATHKWMSITAIGFHFSNIFAQSLVLRFDTKVSPCADGW